MHDIARAANPEDYRLVQQQQQQGPPAVLSADVGTTDAPPMLNQAIKCSYMHLCPLRASKNALCLSHICHAGSKTGG